MAKAEREYWLGFDLGGTKMLAVVYDKAFEPVGKKRCRTKAQLGVEAGVERILNTIDKALEAAGIAAGQLAGIGIGCPGPVDPDAGILFDLPNLGWGQFGMAAALKKRFGCPAVLANDVDIGTYAEFEFGAAKGGGCVLGVFPGTGVGGGYVHRGRILSGTGISSLELGHICVLPDGPLCGCGKRGCLETVGSRLAISSAASVAAYRGEAPYLLEHAGMDLSNIRSGVLADSIAAGDVAVARIVERAAEWLGVGIATAVNLLAPDIVVLGGGLVEAMPKRILKAARRSAASHVMPVYEDRFKIVVAELGDDATVKGAAAWARREILEKRGR